TATNTNDRRKQLEEFFNTVVENGEEGLVVKDALSIYELASRKDSWVKMKPGTLKHLLHWSAICSNHVHFLFIDYGDLTTDIDVVILGAYYGEGRSTRGKGLSTFLCGVKADNNDNGSTP